MFGKLNTHDCYFKERPKDLHIQTQNSNKNLVAIKKAHSDRSTVKFTTFNRHNDNPQPLSLSKFNAPSQ